MAETNYFWDPLSDNILEERDETSAVIAEFTTEPGQFGNVISQERIGVENQFHFDAHGDTVALTDTGQNATDTLAYNAFGELTQRSGLTAIAFQYNGRAGYYHDPLTGVCLVRRRQYSPSTVRWLSLDPAFADDQVWSGVLSLLESINAYCYSQNSPANYTDVTGFASIGDCDDDPCKACNEFVDKHPDKEKKYTYRGEKGTCIARLECAKTCPRGAIGYTAPPVMVALGQYVIDVCISCKAHADSLAALLGHELLHVERFCRTGGGISNCDQCLIQEREAYRISCRIAFPGMDADSNKKRTRCLKCGVYFGCKGFDTADRKCVRDEVDKCSPADIGLKSMD